MADKILSSNNELSTYTVISPTRRASNRLKKELTAQLSTTTWLPEFLTINQWLERLSGLAPADNLELKFTCYNAYIEVMQANAQGISEFFSWCDILIRDFNDIEGQLIDPKPFFKELTDYTEIEHFSFLTSPLTEKQERYRSFWNAIPKIHEKFNEALLKEGLAYTGLMLREAFKNISSPDFKSNQRLFVAGFNAFSHAETRLLKHFQDRGEAEVFYDTDGYYLDQPENHAGVFIRRNLKNKLGEAVSTKQPLSERAFDIELCEAAHRVDQAQVVAGLLAEANPEELRDTVLVLADESLLIPVLDKLPNSLKKPNITMGIGLTDSTFASWIESLYDVTIHKITNESESKLSMEKIQVFLNHPFSQFLNTGIDFEKLEKTGFVKSELLEVNPLFKAEKWVETVLGFWMCSRDKRNESLSQLLNILATIVENPKSPTIAILQSQKGISLLIRGIKQLQNFKEQEHLSDNIHLQLLMRILSGGSIDLLGEPQDTLQIMGLLETRALAFKRVIICGVNEDTLPAKPSLDSFIPFEIRNHHHLPGKKEKEAVYAYNFYRLIQHAEHVKLVYHTDKGDFSGGEKSRYIHQIEYDLKRVNSNLKIVHRHLDRIKTADYTSELVIEKTPEVIAKIREHLQTKLSISSINRYLDDPLDWYYNYILRLREPDTGEINFATFGNIVHEVLENLYIPFKGKVLKTDDLKQMKTMSEALLEQITRKIVMGKNIDTGINKIHLETAKTLILNYLNSELKNIEKGQIITCLATEELLNRTLKIRTESENIDVNFTGSADKIQRRDGVLEILDYKSGNVDPKDLKIKDFTVESMTKVPKAVQLMTYNWMASEVYPDQKINSRIISMPAPYKGDLEILFDKSETEVLGNFEEFLRTVILDMLDPDKLIEKNIAFEYATYE
ncbi:hypothetical protein G3O08_05350 [Cryomorpha ignava]|uniref:PD-(D/E)XK endonuclease-like domain-containing protein n=2 Tax=Cryomorpha ignava TaxID=101383 RepID=A0A7K3WMP3_9FLAO|nr:hypothetical protein [Cryomorpha ignava]